MVKVNLMAKKEERKLIVVKVSGIFSMVFVDGFWAGRYLSRLMKDIEEVAEPGDDVSGAYNSITVEPIEAAPESFIWSCGQCGTLWDPDRFIRKSPDAAFESCPVCGSALVDCVAQ